VLHCDALSKHDSNEFENPDRRLGKLGARDSELLNRRWLGKQGGSLRHECFGNGSVEMSLPSRFICESIEDSKASVSESKRKPHGSRRLLVRELESLL